MNHRGIWLAAGVLAVVVLLAQVAGASTRDVSDSVAANASIAAEMTTRSATISLPAQASSVAEEKSAAGRATANEARESDEAASEHGRTEATLATETNEIVPTRPAAAPHDSTTGARPGFGCGDPNHPHSGPPGRLGATPPRNCTKP
jgi:hypothetical protein